MCLSLPTQAKAEAAAAKAHAAEAAAAKLAEEEAEKKRAEAIEAELAARKAAHERAAEAKAAKEAKAKEEEMAAEAAMAALSGRGKAPVKMASKRPSSPPPIEPPLLPYSTPADEEASQAAIKIMEEAGNAEVMAGELPAPPEVRSSTHSSTGAPRATALTHTLSCTHTGPRLGWEGDGECVSRGGWGRRGEGRALSDAYTPSTTSGAAKCRGAVDGGCGSSCGGGGDRSGGACCA